MTLRSDPKATAARSNRACDVYLAGGLTSTNRHREGGNMASAADALAASARAPNGTSQPLRFTQRPDPHLRRPRISRGLLDHRAFELAVSCVSRTKSSQTSHGTIHALRTMSEPVKVGQLLGTDGRAKNLADFLTKILPPASFRPLRDRIMRTFD